MRRALHALVLFCVLPALAVAAERNMPSAATAALPALTAPLPQTRVEQLAACCKVCRKGKACGNSCIARNKTCHRPPAAVQRVVWL